VKGFNLLLIDDDSDMPALIKGLLEDREVFNLDWVGSLREGLARLKTTKPDVVLLDLHLPDSKGSNTFLKFKTDAPGVPVVVLTSLDDEKFALEAVRKGAQDYLVKGDVNGKRLAQVLRYAMARHQIHRTMAARSSITDEVTGFYNRKGFLMLLSEQMKGMQRTGKGLMLFLSFLHGMSGITEEYGEEEKEQAAKMAAQILKESFRSSDILARVGPDRFVIIPGQDTHYYPKTIARRLDKNPKYYNAQFNLYRLSLSIGSLRISPEPLPSPANVLEKLDEVFESYASQKKGNPSLPHRR
jgi:diguanylate cyclase (GGDEF)-like protein